MNTVTFGEFNSYSDLNLILSSKTIGSPSVKTSTIDLPGSDGELDFTEYFGEPKYSNRPLKFQFTAINPATAATLKFAARVTATLCVRAAALFRFG
mgnify:CR=1 FL=1